MKRISTGLSFSPERFLIIRMEPEKTASKQCRDIFGAWGGVEKTILTLLKRRCALASIRFPIMREYRPDFSKASPSVLQFIIRYPRMDQLPASTNSPIGRPKYGS